MRSGTGALLASLLVLAGSGSARAGVEVKGWLKQLSAVGWTPQIRFAADGGLDQPSPEAGLLGITQLRLEGSAGLGDLGRIDLALVGFATAGGLADPFGTTSTGGEVGLLTSSVARPGRLLSGRASATVEGGSLDGAIDRLSVELWLGPVEIIAGRQAIGWGRTLVFQPTDLLDPFSPVELDTEARPGIDALRLRIAWAFDGTIDLVANPDRDLKRAAWAGRVTAVLGSTELGVLGGWIRDEGVAGFDGMLTLDLWSLRWEGLLRARRDGGLLFAGALGVDVFLLGGDLTLLAEIFHDDQGAGDPAELRGVLLSERLADGRIRIPGRHVAAAGGSWQISSLWKAQLTALVDAGDGSAFGAAVLTWSVLQSVDLDLLAYVPFGPAWTRAEDGLPAPASAFGAFPTLVGAYLRVYR